MKKLGYLFLFALPLLGAGSPYGSTVDPAINNIRVAYSHIRSGLKSYRVVVVDRFESTEGGQEKGYYDGESLKLIEVVDYGETGQYQSQYYFSNAQLVFVLETNYRYNAPITYDKANAKENNGLVFDFKKSTVTKNRYYFQQEKLICWMNAAKKPQNILAEITVQEGRKVVQTAQKLKAELRK